jgi:hypothetical protein
MTINVNVTESQIEVSASGQDVNATVSGGVGPAGPAGPPGTTDYGELDNVPATFPPSAHTHTQSEVDSSLGNDDLAGDLQDIIASSENASNLSAGTVATGRLATSGVASSSTFLRGDQTWSAAPVTSVAGKTGAVSLDKGDVGLGNADNTSDANKPISTATQSALDGKAATAHTHAAADITSGTLADARLSVDVRNVENVYLWSSYR